MKEHKISFKPIQSFEYKVTEEEEKTATPRLISHNNIKDVLLTNKIPVKGKSSVIPPSDPLPIIETEVKDSDEQLQTPQKVVENSTKNNGSMVSVDLPDNEKENKPETNSLSDESFELVERFSKLKVKMCSPMRPSQRAQLTKKIDSDNNKNSILKEDDPFKQQTLKTVSFSPTKNVVHVFEPELKNDTNPEKPAKTETIVIKNSSNQSNIVIRRMIIQKAENK